MNILLLCDLFPPAFAPRMGYLCKYLQRAGWKVTIVTEHIEDTTFATLTGNQDVTYVKFKTHWLWTLALDILCDYKEKRFFRETMKTAAGKSFDAILCSSYRSFPLLAAAMTSRRLGLPMVVDLRDIVEQYAGTEYISHKIPNMLGLGKRIALAFGKKTIKRRNVVLKTAACVTSVSPWHVSVLKNYNKNVRLIYNGYDAEMFFPAPVESPQFYITYTGRLLSTAMRDPSMFFEAILKLSREGLITPEKLRVRWFVDMKSKQIITEEVRKYAGIDVFMDYFGYIPSEDVPRILNESAMLLVLTNNTSKGVMTTKFFEYLAVGRPVLCVRSDEGCLAEVIRSTNAGLSAVNVDEIYKFIHHNFEEWSNNRVSNSKRELVGQFSREAQAKEFMQIFNYILF